MNPSVFVNGETALLLMLGLLFAFSNGYRDASSIVATVVSTRTLTPNAAFLLSAVFEFIGALLIGSAVASTVSARVIGDGWQPTHADILATSIVALGSAGVWGFISWWNAWPTSNGHALLGALTGAGWAAWGLEHMQNRTILFIFAVLVVSPFIGFFISLLITTLLRWTGGWLTTRVKPMADGLHVLSCLFVSSAHGSNDGQLVMGVLLPVLGSATAVGEVPFSLRFVVAIALATGVMLGGRRILKKLGLSFYRIQNLQGLSAEFTTASTVLACGISGFPASTTQVIAGSLMGAAAAKDPRRARWAVAQEIAISWAVTFPMAALLAFVAMKIFRLAAG